MTKNLTEYSRYVLAYKLVEFSEEIVEKNKIESLCPEKL